MTDHTPALPSDPSLTPLTPQDERLWATLINAGGILFAFVPALLGYVLLKDRSSFVRDHSISALNFQITVLIVATVAVITFVGVLLLPIILIVDVVLSIIAALEANRGNSYVYPLSIKFIR